MFLEKYITFGKDFGKIAPFLPNKNIQEIVTYYYDHKYHLGLKKLLQHKQRRASKPVGTLLYQSLQPELHQQATKVCHARVLHLRVGG